MPMLRERTEQEPPTEETLPQIYTQHDLTEHSKIPPFGFRRLSEESIRTELCDGPMPDDPVEAASSKWGPDQAQLQDLELELELDPGQEQALPSTVSDRAELIERLKRGESPTWVPHRHLEPMYQQDTFRFPSKSPRPPSRSSSALLPPSDISPKAQSSGDSMDEKDIQARVQEGLNIERPRSALHSGNFTPEEPTRREVVDDVAHPQYTPRHFQSGPQAWLATSPPRDYATPYAHFDPGAYRRQAFNRSAASSLSSSLSSSFVYMPPTSPLVQSESNEELDLALPLHRIEITGDQNRAPGSRRHTLHFSHATPPRMHPPYQRHIQHPYQAHQPRRSLNSVPSFPLGDLPPQSPGNVRARRPSLSSDASSLHHASLVGSYEESILRGRMSTTPSKPLDFMAQIGVLGLGKCKPSLRCPSHVTLPFSAVFYSYSSTSHGRTKSEDGPSPYVGNIDLENGLTNPDDEQRAKRKKQSRYPERLAVDNSMAMDDVFTGPSESDGRRAPNPKRRTRSPKAPPGGRYRIPEKGQLQIIIKNQNKTAVKLFLVPYDLAGMEPGTKTFIRQRSYSAGPLMDNVPGMHADAALDSLADRPVLRYLVHLHICCPSKGRFYLYKSIRVVFANRVPDGKEKLRNEVTCPEPRFSPYKPTRVMHAGSATVLATEQALQRRSGAFSFSGQLEGPSNLDTYGLPNYRPAVSTLYRPHQDAKPVDPGPYQPPWGNSFPHGASWMGSDAPASLRSPTSSDRTMRPPTGDSGRPGHAAGGGGDVARYDKLNKGDVGYGGTTFGVGPGSPGQPPLTEGLLSQRLRSLGVKGRQESRDESVEQ